MNYNAMTQAEKLLQDCQRNQKEYLREQAIIKEAILDAVEIEGTKIFLQLLKDLSLWDKVDENINPEILSYHRGRRDIWSIVRTYLPKDILAEIEIYDKYRIEKEERQES